MIRARRAARTLKAWLGLPQDARPTRADLETLLARLPFKLDPRLEPGVAPQLIPRRDPRHFTLLAPVDAQSFDAERLVVWAVAVMVRLRRRPDPLRPGDASSHLAAQEQVAAAFVTAWFGEEEGAAAAGPAPTPEISFLRLLTEPGNRVAFHVPDPDAWAIGFGRPGSAVVSLPADAAEEWGRRLAQHQRAAGLPEPRIPAYEGQEGPDRWEPFRRALLAEWRGEEEAPGC